MNKLSIRTAILLPFLFIIIAIVIIFTVMMTSSYERLAYEQGTKLMTSMNEVAEDNLVTLLKEPKMVNTLFGSLIHLNKYYLDKDYAVLETITLSLMKDIKESIPQVSSIGYGDENKNFLGIRRNLDDTYTLMVKDQLTDYMLNIYSGETRDSEVIAAYEAYDPTTRPWYLPLVDNAVAQWSDIYINMDELNNATITSLVPILDDQGNLVSVTGIDINLNGLNVFLNKIALDNKGTIYIVDENSRMIAHSTNEAFINILETEPPSAEYTLASTSVNPEVSSSAVYFENNDDYKTVKLLEINGEKFYTLKNKIDPSLGLDWSIVVVVSENNLIGNIAQSFADMRLMLIVLAFVGLVIGVVLISFFISSVTHMAKTVQTITSDNLEEIHFKDERANFKEISELKKAYNTMVEKLSQSFSNVVKSEKKYRSLMENSDAYIFSIDKNGMMLTFNSLVKEFTARSSQDIIGRSFYDLFIEENHRDTWKEHIKVCCQNNTAYNTTYEYSTQEHVRAVFKVKILPLVNESGQVDQLIATFIDIVELVKSQEEVACLMTNKNKELEALVQERTLALEHAMKELIQKEKLASLGSLVSGISHEINTPLGVAVSASSYLKSIVLKNKDKLLGGKLTKTEFVKFVNHMEDSAVIVESNLVRAIELVQSFKRISVNQTYDENVLFNVKSYLEATLKSLHHELRTKGHEVSYECAEEIEILGNPGSFTQVFTNLILNSIVHGYDKGQRGKISIRVVSVDDFVKIEFHDDGKGISKEIQNNIFDPFFTTNRSQGGSGLGLNIVYNIVTGQFNGKITVVSDSDVGTTFTILLRVSDKEV